MIKILPLLGLLLIGCSTTTGRYDDKALVEPEQLGQERIFPAFGVSDVVQVGIFAGEGRTVGIVVDGPFSDPKAWHEWRYKVYLPNRGVYTCKQKQLTIVQRFDWAAFDKFNRK